MANSLAHSKWCASIMRYTAQNTEGKSSTNNCARIQQDIRDLCKWKGAEFIEGNMMPDHVHLLLSIPPKYSVSGFMGYLKGK